MKPFRVLGLSGILLFGVWNQATAQSGSVERAPDPTQIEDVVVTGLPLERQANAYVSSVGAAPPGRKLATWSGTLCVGSIGLAAEPARFMVDRVLDWAHSLGLRISPPGCSPNVLIVSSDDGDRTARELVKARPFDFDAGVANSHLGSRALRNFQDSGRPVRWWHVSLPIDPDTGDALVRRRSEAPFTPLSVDGIITRPGDLGTYGQILSGSRLYDDSLDHLQSVVVVIDAAALEQASFAQLSDYVAMIALAQIDPEAAPAAPSILNLFHAEAAQEATLTRWDRAYLEALYGASQRNVSPDADGALIASVLVEKLGSGFGAAADPGR